MKLPIHNRLSFSALFSAALLLLAEARKVPTCSVSPLGVGKDDTDQVLAAIEKCGQGGHVTLEEGSFNITRKMTWNLAGSTVDLYGSLSFVPDIDYWLNANNTYRVVFIQSQASWFVVTGHDFVIDAHNVGGIHGNGQPWWNHFTSVPRLDGDGRPISFTVYQAQHAKIRNFRIESPPFWCNTVAESKDVIYDGMLCNATNTNATFFGTNIVPNTDGIDTYRSDNVSLLNWDVTCGDDCLAVKGNTTNLTVKNVVCRGGNGVAFGSLAQYVNLTDIVDTVHMENITMTRINTTIQPNMKNGIYFKSWDGTVNGAPPTGGGGAPGYATNIVTRDIVLDRVDRPMTISQTNGGHSGDRPSIFKFGNISFENWSGTALSSTVVALECSSAVNCTNIHFSAFNVSLPAGVTPKNICQNAVNVTGLNVCP